MACVSASARIPSGFVRDFKRQAAELRRTGREAARGFKLKIDGVLHPKLPHPYFYLAPAKKLLAFEHGRDTDLFIYEFIP